MLRFFGLVATYDQQLDQGEIEHDDFCECRPSINYRSGNVNPATNCPCAGPRSHQTLLQSISYSGTGCPQGTVGQSISNARDVFTLIFDSFVASSGPGVPVTESLKACQVNLTLHIPAGMSMWVQTSTAHGYVQLPAGVTANQKSTVLLSNPAGKSNDGADDAEDGSGVSRRTLQTDFKGPVAKDYTLADGHTYTVQAACNTPSTTRTLTLQYSVQTNGATQQSQITTDSVDGKINVLQERVCGKDRD